MYESYDCSASIVNHAGIVNNALDLAQRPPRLFTALMYITIARYVVAGDFDWQLK
jgi:hypothetical protein